MFLVFILSLVLFEKLSVNFFFIILYRVHELSMNFPWTPHGLHRNCSVQKGNSDMVEWTPGGVHLESIWTSWTPDGFHVNLWESETYWRERPSS